MQSWRGIATADVLLHALEMLDRHVELVALGVLELHVLALLPGLAHQPHPDEASDPVIHVHDQVARLELQLPGRRAGADHPTTHALTQAAKDVAIAETSSSAAGSRNP